MKVLVADDSSVIRRIVVDTLRDVGATDVVEAANGSEALAACQQQAFDLIVIDRVMPGKGGVAVTKAIRAQGLQVPIVMVSATGIEREEIVEAIEAGVSDYLLKPFDIAALHDKLAKLCGQRC